MIEYIKGELATLEPMQAVIDCSGVGYRLEISLASYDALQRMTSDDGKPCQVKLLVHEVIREDEHLLYGFSDEAERSMFRLLIGVNGVGVATARMMLSSLTVDQLREAIASQDVKTIQRIKGIGAKTAQRIALELQDKVGGTPSLASNVSGAAANSRGEALSALTMLGFQRSAAEKVLQGLPATLSVEEMIKEALQKL